MRRVATALVAGIALILTAAPSAGAAGKAVPTARGGGASAIAAGGTTGRLLVTLRRPELGRARAAATARTVAARARGRARRTVPQLGALAVTPGPDGPRATAARLRADPRVARVEVERRYELRYQPNDPSFTAPEQNAAGAVVSWWAVRQGFLSAWDIARGDGARVAVIDTGIDANHPELAGRVLESVDFDEDPRHGPASADEIGHGTHVASLACAAADNGTGLAGAGLGCGLLIAKTDFTESSVAKSIVWAADRGAHAINMSFGTDGRVPASNVVVEAIRYAVAKGAVPVAAAADEPTDQQGDPANVLQPTGTGADLTSNLGLSVTAADARDARAEFAGRGSQISLGAYGTWGGRAGPPGILGAFPEARTALEGGSVRPGGGCQCRTTFAGDQRYAYLQGTSMSAPMVAGVAALMRDLNPDLSSEEVVRIIKERARRPPGTGWTPELGWGILDAAAAVDAAGDVDRRPPVSRMLTPRVRGRSIQLKWTGVDTGPGGVRASGVEYYEVWRQAGTRPPQRLRVIRGTKLRVLGKRGSRYGFFTVGVDAAGNHEAKPARPDIRVSVKKLTRTKRAAARR